MKENRLLSGSITISLLILAVPIIISNLLQTAYQLTDLFWVGRLGASSIAAVTLSFSVIFFFISLGIGMSMAGSILVAQYKGKDEQGGINFVVSQSFAVVVSIAVFLSWIGYYCSPYIISLMKVEPLLESETVGYLRVSFMGIPFVFGYLTFQGLLRGVGEVKKPMYIVLGTVLLNLLADPLLIFGFGVIPPLGVSGAAAATIVTQGLAMIVGISVMLSGKWGIKLSVSSMMPDLRFIKRLLALGVPTSVGMSTRALGMMLMAFLVAGFGTVTTAAFGIGTHLISFIILPAIGLAMATSTLVGQNIGAGNVRRAERTAVKSAILAMLLLTVSGVIVWWLAEPITALFTKPGSPVLQEGTLFIKIMALTFGFTALQQVLLGVFQGSGNTGISMMISISTLWLFQLPVAWYLSRYTVLQSEGIWWAFPVSNISGAVLALIWFAKGRWKEKKILDKIKFPRNM